MVENVKIKTQSGIVSLKMTSSTNRSKILVVFTNISDHAEYLFLFIAIYTYYEYILQGTPCSPLGG